MQLRCRSHNNEGDRRNDLLFYVLAAVQAPPASKLHEPIVFGIGMALTYPSIGAMTAEKVPAVQRGLAMGMYNSCIYLGMMFGSTVNQL